MLLVMCSDAGLPEPVIREMNGGVQVVMNLHPVESAVDSEIEKETGGTIGGAIDGTIGGTIGGQTGGQIGGQTSGQVGGQTGGQVESLSDRQRDILEIIIIANPKISRKQLAEELKINESAVQKHIDALKKKNIIERDSATSGQWIIKVNK